MLRRCRYSDLIGTLRQSSSLSKLMRSAQLAVSDMPNSSLILFGGFGLTGIAENLIEALCLTNTSNDAGTQRRGVGNLVEFHQVKRLISSYVGENDTILERYACGELEVEFVPQGTLAEKIRAGGSGIPAFYTRTGVETAIEYGGLPIKYNSHGKVEIHTQPKPHHIYKNIKYLIEEALTGDFAFVRAKRADTYGNLIFHGAAMNFNVDVAKAAKVVIAEVDEIVPLGSLPPDTIHLPGVYVHRIVQHIPTEESPYQHLVYHDDVATANSSSAGGENEARIRIAKRAALELHAGMTVNLGIGIPTPVADYIPADVPVQLHSENGILGMGPYPRRGEEDPDIINAGKETITLAPGASVFSSSESFAMIRGRHIDVTVLGAFEVSQEGDIASWMIPGKRVNGMGGAMDLVVGCKKVIVAMTHCTKNGKPKIVKSCTLPLTGHRVVHKIITEKAVFKFSGSQLVLVEIAPNCDLKEIYETTEADFVPSDTLQK